MLPRDRVAALGAASAVAADGELAQHPRMSTAWLLSLAVIAATEAPSSAAPSSAEAPSPTTTRVVALPLVDDGAGAELTNTASSLVAVSLSRIPGLSVLSGDDVRAAADLDAQKQMLGCAETSCLAEIAAALGADRMVHGRVGRLGTTVVVTLSMFDAKASNALGREVVQSNDVSTLPAEIDDAVRRLTGGPAAAVEDAGPGMLLIAGGATAVVGAAVAGVGALGALGAVGALESTTTTGKEKTDAEASRPLWTMTTIGGLAIATIGVGVAVAGVVME